MTYEEITANANLIAEGYYCHQSIHNVVNIMEIARLAKFYERTGNIKQAEIYRNFTAEIDNILTDEYESYLDDFQAAENIAQIRQYIEDSGKRYQQLKAIAEAAEKHQ